MIERVVGFLAEIAVRVIGPNACADAIARRQFGALGRFAIYAAVPDEEDDDDDEDDPADQGFDSGTWGGWLQRGR